MHVPQLRRRFGLRSAGGCAGRDVTDFGRSCAAVVGCGGVRVNFGHSGAAEFVGDRFEHFAGRGIFDGSNGAADVDGVADTHADLVAYVDDEGVSANVGHQAGIGGFNDGQCSGSVVELRGAIVDGLVDRFAEDGLGEIATRHAEGAATSAI